MSFEFMNISSKSSTETWSFSARLAVTSMPPKNDVRLSSSKLGTFTIGGLPQRFSGDLEKTSVTGELDMVGS